MDDSPEEEVIADPGTEAAGDESEECSVLGRIGEEFDDCTVKLDDMVEELDAAAATDPKLVDELGGAEVVETPDAV